jgi:hypothetical protein
MVPCLGAQDANGAEYERSDVLEKLSQSLWMANAMRKATEDGRYCTDHRHLNRYCYREPRVQYVLEISYV